jgi:excisionase family DNA binding protein
MAVHEKERIVRIMEKMTMDLKELQETFGISYCTAYNLTQRKDFPSFRIGKRILINREELKLWMKEQEQKKGLCD